MQCTTSSRTSKLYKNSIYFCWRMGKLSGEPVTTPCWRRCRRSKSQSTSDALDVDIRDRSADVTDRKESYNGWMEGKERLKLNFFEVSLSKLRSTYSLHFGRQNSTSTFGGSVMWAVWPVWAVYYTLGNFSKPLAVINLAKVPTSFSHF